jgi:hypothetical protein
MRPREAWNVPTHYFIAEQPRIEITAHNFPELHATVQAMFADSRVRPHRMWLYPKLPGAFQITSGHEIRLSARQMARQDFDSFIAMIGHEIGHDWQYTRQKPHTIGIRSEHFSWRHHNEVQADMFARCLTGSTDNIIHGLTRAGAPDIDDAEHPSNSRRMAALKAMHSADCDYFNLVPPLLRKQSSNKKARE